MRPVTMAVIALLAGPLMTMAASNDDVLKGLRARMTRHHAEVGRYVMTFYYPWYGTERTGDRGRHWGNWELPPTR